MDRPLDVRVPDIDVQPVDEWGHDVMEVSDELAGENGDVIYGEVASQLDIPKSFVVTKLGQSEYTPVTFSGAKASRVSTEWDNLTDRQKSTLLTWAFFPEKTHQELADLDLSGYDSQSDVSRIISKFGWMFSEPSIDTPIEPNPEKSREAGSLKTVGTAEDMVKNIEQNRNDQNSEEDGGEEYECEHCGSTFESGQEMGGHVRWCPEDPDNDLEESDSATADDNTAARTTIAEEDASAGDVADSDGTEQTAIYSVLTKESTFEVLAALIETDRYELAEAIFDKAVGSGGVELGTFDGD